MLETQVEEGGVKLLFPFEKEASCFSYTSTIVLFIYCHKYSRCTRVCVISATFRRRLHVFMLTPSQPPTAAWIKCYLESFATRSTAQAHKPSPMLSCYFVRLLTPHLMFGNLISNSHYSSQDSLRKASYPP